MLPAATEEVGIPPAGFLPAANRTWHVQNGARRLRVDPEAENIELRQRVAALERALTLALQAEQQQKARADRADASCRRAWAVVTGPPGDRR